MKRFHGGMARPALLAAFLAGGYLLGPASPVRAHDIPVSVVIQGFVRPEGDRLRILLRVPMESMYDTEFDVRAEASLNFDREDPMILDAIRTQVVNYLQVYEESRLLGEPNLAAFRVSIPSDRSFATYEEALANIQGPPLPPETQLYWAQSLLDVLVEYPITSATSNFSIRPAFAHLGIRTATVLRFQPPGGQERIFQVTGNPELIRLDPSWFQATWQFVKLGFFHILGGIDHILFVLCLVIPIRHFVTLLSVVTSFTLAHSITLIASALGYAPGGLWFPPFIETLIALSIVYMALENIVGAQIRRRWLFTFGFGLVHGFGFSFLLRDSLQFAGSHLTASLLAFNVGVELGQIFVLAIAVPALALLFRYGVPERVGGIILSALVAHTAWHWMIDRGSMLMEFPIVVPAFDLAFWAVAMRTLMFLLILGGVGWALFALFDRLIPSGGTRPPAARPPDAPLAPRSAPERESVLTGE